MPTLLQFTDTHITRDPQGTLKGVVTRQSLTECVSQAQSRVAKTACHILLTGDLSHDASPESYQALQDIITPLNLPVSALPGNHDIASHMQQHLPADWTRGEYTVGSWQIIMLNSAVTGEEHGFISEEEIQRAEKILSTTKQTHTLICLHHQPVPVGSQWIDNIMLQNPEALFNLVDDYQHIKGLLFGHVHQDFQSQYKQATIIGTPSTCIQFQRNSSVFSLENIAPAFRILHLHGNGEIDSELSYLEHISELKPDEAY